MDLIYTYKNGDSLFWESFGRGEGGVAKILDDDFEIVVGEIWAHSKSFALLQVREIYKNHK